MINISKLSKQELSLITLVIGIVLGISLTIIFFYLNDTSLNSNNSYSYNSKENEDTIQLEDVYSVDTVTNFYGQLKSKVSDNQFIVDFNGKNIKVILSEDVDIVLQTPKSEEDFNREFDEYDKKVATNEGQDALPPNQYIETSIKLEDIKEGSFLNIDSNENIIGKKEIVANYIIVN